MAMTSVKTETIAGIHSWTRCRHRQISGSSTPVASSASHLQLCKNHRRGDRKTVRAKHKEFGCETVFPRNVCINEI
ncbi:rCG53402, isoform CRA_b [Rattus norvegicus]|uniref:RCG53402, isoform CRA_b n=1 Tax=Rattus norvegicus TaxID=10116 RepID=A6JRJ5_RAT|nr:rCG53402, isoform CRA_b [Rattus norvegicus]